MAKEVIKKDGTREPFAAEKIMDSISAAATEANLSEEMKNEAVKDVSSIVIQFAESKETITTGEIKEKILAELDKSEPSVSAAWRAYETREK
ncbi:MAG: ATP cone domain-containing protein [Patescibacteria group bacterium]